MSNPAISIIIPFYNMQWFMLEECLESVCRQSMTDYEVLLISDGVADEDLLTQCKNYVADKSQITFYENYPNQGVSYSRNFGIEHAKGEYILFVDSDDWLEPEALGKLWEAASEGKNDAVFFEYNWCCLNAVTPKFRSIDYDCHKLNRQMVERLLLSTDFNSPCTILYQRRLLTEKKIRFFNDIKMGEDFLFNVEYLKQYQNGKYLREGLYNYRYNQNSATNTFLMKHVEDTDVLYKTKKELIKEYYPEGFSEELYEVFYGGYLKNIRAFMMNGINSGASDKQLAYCIDLEWVQDTLNYPYKGALERFTKNIIRRKCFVALRILARIKQIMRQKYCVNFLYRFFARI